jgi:hypothetical protein
MTTSWCVGGFDVQVLCDDKPITIKELNGVSYAVIPNGASFFESEEWETDPFGEPFSQNYRYTPFQVKATDTQYGRSTHIALYLDGSKAGTKIITSREKPHIFKGQRQKPIPLLLRTLFRWHPITHPTSISRCVLRCASNLILWISSPSTTTTTTTRTGFDTREGVTQFCFSPPRVGNANNKAGKKWHRHPSIHQSLPAPHPRITLMSGEVDPVPLSHAFGPLHHPPFPITPPRLHMHVSACVE